MTRTFYPGAWYADALASGARAVLFPASHIQTHLGRVDLPPADQPLYHRITDVGGTFKIAGQAHHSPRTLEWINGTWWDRPPACGVSPVIYDHAGNLHISNCGPVGSQGFRYVADDGRIVTGDQSYGPLHGLSEWSAYGGLLIGQGHAAGGCLVWDGTVLRVLEPGDCRFIRVQGHGVNVAISFVKPDGAVIVQTTIAELRALPKVGTIAPTPPPPRREVVAVAARRPCRVRHPPPPFHEPAIRLPDRGT